MQLLTQTRATDTRHFGPESYLKPKNSTLSSSISQENQEEFHLTHPHTNYQRDSERSTEKMGFQYRCKNTSTKTGLDYQKK